MDPLLFGSFAKILFLFSLLIYVGHGSLIYANPSNELLHNTLEKNEQDRSVEPSLKVDNKPLIWNGTIEDSYRQKYIKGIWSLQLTKNLPAFTLNMNISHVDPSKKSTSYHFFNYIQGYNKLSKATNSILNIVAEVKFSKDDKISKSTTEIEINLLKTGQIKITFLNYPLNKEFELGIKGNISNSNFGKIDKQNNLISEPKDIDKSPHTLNQSINDIVSNNSNNSKSNNNASGNTIKAIGGKDNSNKIFIPKYAAERGNSYYEPKTININEGNKIKVTNNDSQDHTITSVNDENSQNPQIGKYFDTGIIKPHKTITLDTSNLKPGIYPYGCNIHSFMKGEIIVN